MSNCEKKWERRCRCGREFEVTDTEMANGLGRYCGDHCLNESIAREKGSMWDFNFRPRGGTRTYEANVWFSYPRYTRYKYRHFDYRFIGDPQNKLLYRIVWEGRDRMKHSKNLPSPLTYRDLRIIFEHICGYSPEAMFQTILTALAGKDDFESLLLMVKAA